MGKKSVRMIHADFNYNTGISTVTINSRYGKFTGTARLHPADVDHPSEFAGCEYAEIRANIKYMKARKAECRVQLKTMQDFYNNIASMKNFNPNSWESKRIRKTIYGYEKQIKLWTDRIQSAEKMIRDHINQRDASISQMSHWTKVDK